MRSLTLDSVIGELIDRAPIGLARLDPSLRIVHANARLGELVGRAPHELVGLLPTDVVPTLTSAIVDALERGRNGIETRGIEYEGSPPGSGLPSRIVRVDVSPVLGVPAESGIAGIDVIVTDVTEAHRHERYVEALQEVAARAGVALSRAELGRAVVTRLIEATLEQIPAGVFVAESGRGLVFQSQDVTRILGGDLPLGELASAQLVRRTLDGEPLPIEEWPLMRALDRGETVVGHESVVDRLDGRGEVVIRTSARPVRNQAGTIVGAVAAFQDVTRDVEAATAREAFLGILSHELRTPLTSIYGGASLLARHPEEAATRLRAVIEDVEVESQRLLRLVEDVLVLARIERQMPLAEREPVLVQRVIEKVVREERRHHPGIGFGLCVEPGLAPVVGDASRLEVVVRNLLSNAAKYGAGSATVSAGEVDGRVLVSVEDTGPGFRLDPAELFEPFRRGDHAGETVPGSGIGLFICRALVEGMGGRIWAENLPTGGAAFRFVLELADVRTA